MWMKAPGAHTHDVKKGGLLWLVPFGDIAFSSYAPSQAVMDVDGMRDGVVMEPTASCRHYPAREHQRPNLDFALLDINDLRFESEFDLLFSNATLHWIKDHRRLLRNSHRAHRPDGMVRYNSAAEGNCSHLFKVLPEVMSRKPAAKHFADFEWPWYMPPVDEYRELVSELPFREARVWCENADRHFPDVGAMVAWVDQPSLVPFLKHLDEPDRRSFRDAVVERMMEETLQQDGRCFETFRRVVDRLHGHRPRSSQAAQVLPIVARATHGDGIGVVYSRPRSRRPTQQSCDGFMPPSASAPMASSRTRATSCLFGAPQALGRRLYASANARLRTRSR